MKLSLLIQQLMLSLFLLALTSCTASQSNTTNFSDTQIIDNILRNIVINYQINEDRKIPKENRKKWEDSFSEYIDFKSLNNSMKEDTKKAFNKYSESPVDEKTLNYYGEKAVAFQLPKYLIGFAIGQLKIQSKIGELPKCSQNRKPTLEEQVIACTERSGNTIKVYWLAADTGDSTYMLNFKKTDKWRLHELHDRISKASLETLGYLK